jgi:hypothetical protein
VCGATGDVRFLQPPCLRRKAEPMWSQVSKHTHEDMCWQWGEVTPGATGILECTWPSHNLWNLRHLASPL